MSYLDPAALAHAAPTAWLACVDHAALPLDTHNFGGLVSPIVPWYAKDGFGKFGLRRIDIYEATMSARLCNDGA